MRGVPAVSTIGTHVLLYSDTRYTPYEGARICVGGLTDRKATYIRFLAAANPSLTAFRSTSWQQ